MAGWITKVVQGRQVVGSAPQHLGIRRLQLSHKPFFRGTCNIPHRTPEGTGARPQGLGSERWTRRNIDYRGPFPPCIKKTQPIDHILVRSLCPVPGRRRRHSSQKTVELQSHAVLTKLNLFGRVRPKTSLFTYPLISHFDGQNWIIRVSHVWLTRTVAVRTRISHRRDFEQANQVTSHT